MSRVSELCVNASLLFVNRQWEKWRRIHQSKIVQYISYTYMYNIQNTNIDIMYIT